MQRKGQDFHDAGDEVCKAQEDHALLCDCDDRGAVRQDVEQCIVEEHEYNTEQKAGSCRVQCARFNGFPDAVKPPGTEILPYHGHGCKRNRIADRVYKSVKLTCDRIGGHGIGTHGVDRRGNDHVGNIEAQTTGRSRNTDLDHLAELQPPHSEVLSFYFTDTLAPYKGNRSHDERNQMGKYRRDGNTRDRKPQNANKHYIQQNVQHTGDQHVLHRTHAVARSAENCRNKIIQHGKRHAEEIYLHIQHRHVEYIRLALHPNKELSCEEQRDGHEEQSGTKANNKSRSHSAPYADLIP